MSNNLSENDSLSSIQSDNPVNKVISSGIQIYFPLSKDTKTLQIGVLFDPSELIKIYIQVNAVTEDIVIQFKIIELHVPITLTELFFNLGLAHFYSQKFMILMENLKVNITGNLTRQIQRNLEEALKKIKDLNKRQR